LALGHVPIIDINPRGNKKRKQELKEENQRFNFINFKELTDSRYNERSNVEMVNGRLKDEFGGKMCGGPQKSDNVLSSNS